MMKQHSAFLGTFKSFVQFVGTTKEIETKKQGDGEERPPSSRVVGIEGGSSVYQNPLSPQLLIRHRHR